MISISLPTTSPVYFTDQGFLIGPVVTSGAYESISYRHPGDHITNDGSRLYHEKDVDHVEYSGTVTYYPEKLSAWASPTVSYPCHVTAQHGSTGSQISSVFGFVSAHVPRGKVDNPWQQACVIASSTNDWTVYFFGTNSASKVTNMWARRYVVTSVSQFTIQVNRYVASQMLISSQYFSAPWNPFQVCTFNQFMSAVSTMESIKGPVVFGSPSVQNYTRYNLYYTMPPGISQTLKSRVETALRWLEEEKHYQPLVEYGSLAVDASEQVNATHINMLAFLRDIRNPTQMIPKLRNLKKLKSYADAYLSVEYGLLPTISDLQNIFEAVGRLKPHFDRNGFKTFHSGTTTTLVANGITGIREQRLKLAIRNEDDALCSILNGLESVGILPTFNNVWDLLPYSFVVDWFVDIGDYLARVDTHLRLMRLSISYVTMSHKKSATQVLGLGPLDDLVGDLSMVSYHRWVSDQCPLPSLSSLNSHIGSFNHWLEASALLVQRKR